MMEFKKLAKKYIHHRNLLIRGQLELGVITGLSYTGMIVGIFLNNLFHIQTSNVVYIVANCVMVVAFLQYLFGWFYERKKLFEEENTWITDRTPILQTLIEIHKKLEKIELMIENKKMKEENKTP